MDTLPNFFLFPPGQPNRFGWPQRARETLGPRFARQGIDLATLEMLEMLATLEAIEAAMAQVIVAEFQRLTPLEKTHEQRINPLFDLQFVTDPLYGLPIHDLATRREPSHATHPSGTMARGTRVVLTPRALRVGVSTGRSRGVRRASRV